MHNQNFGSSAKRFASVSLALAMSLLLGGPAFAIEYGGFGGRPAHPRADNPRTESIFVHTLELGAVQEEGVNIVNNSQEPKTILVYAVDSTPSTGGAFACAQADDPLKDVGAWIALEEGETTLEPGTNKIIPFTITVPENASVGEHNGCIIMQEKKPPVQDGAGATLSFRTGLRVAVTIPGELVRKLEVVDFTVDRGAAGHLLRPVVRNAGNTSIDANVIVTTKNILGFSYAIHGGQYPILRGQQSEWNFDLKKPFWGGWYRSGLTVEYDANPEASVGVQSGKSLTRLEGPTRWFFAFPTIPGLIAELAILAALIGGGFLMFVSKKRNQWIRKSWVMYEIRPGDDIRRLAERFAVSWRLLVKVNRLQAPYVLSPGERIKVPPAK